ncbi:MAG: molecular chaperone TorD family protein [Anaerolineales bacterium]|nr:molecular chaperone TorD family protein [Anaerolineales bacterium]
MTNENPLSRAQVYKFLADAFVYPRENWTEDVPLLNDLVQQAGLMPHSLNIRPTPLADLQFAYRHTFGIAGSLCYETEYGLPHEYRQSQEMADLAGFYQAFGFRTGGKIRERPDHVAVELEFMSLLAVKEAYAREQQHDDHAAICQEAQIKFLTDHLGNWFALFTQSVHLNAHEDTYRALAHFASHFLQWDAARLGVQWTARERAQVKHTPFDPDMSCASCCLPGQRVQIEM